ncbi:hypothetical protein FQN54_001017 [Arachnomyces sp. PD_36]|nr:hypothetical protein FQN54_001017 [Arachnomyces sp. PD_36]
MTDWIRSSSEPDAKGAYAAAMMGTVMLRTGKQPKRRVADFKSQALEFYGTIRTTATGRKEKFCHLLGIWRINAEVRVAHIVPQSLDRDSMVHLFGSDVNPQWSPRNALSLSTRLETALDCGEIVIVPILGEPGEWKCVVTHSGLNETACYTSTWEDINGKKLTFLNEARPRRRYLFFRYLITYMLLKKDGNVDWAEKIHNEYRAWCSPGSYLQQSTLRTLLQQATGEDLPETMFRMFDITTDMAAEDLPLSATNHREEAVSQLVATAVLDTRLTDADRESGDESDEE